MVFAMVSLIAFNALSCPLIATSTLLDRTGHPWSSKETCVKGKARSLTETLGRTQLTKNIYMIQVDMAAYVLIRLYCPI
jgi:hypothetical protein